MAYTPTNWTNFPSTATPVNASNLNKIESELVALDTEKVDKVEGKGLSTNDFDNTYKDKLDGISEQANKVEITPVVTEGTTLATISIDGVDTDIKGSDIDVDSAMSPTSPNPVQNKVIYETLQNILPEETAEGNPISITDASGLSAKSCEVTMNPIQDLHGQSAPYPAGGGKNKYSGTDIETTSDGSAHTDYTMSLPAGTYTFSAQVTSDSGDSSVAISLRNSQNSQIRKIYINVSSSRQSATVTLEEDAVKMYFYAGYDTTTKANTTYSNIQIESGSSMTDYAPYSNICPISGRDSVVLGVSGYNLWDEEWEHKKGYSTGQMLNSDSNLASKNFIKVFPSASYYLVIPSIFDGFLYQYDSEQNFILAQRLRTGGLFSAGANTHYIKFASNNDAFTDGYGNNISINYPSTVTAYNAYKGQTHTATFPDTAYNGSYNFVSGEGTSNYGMVDLGTLTWEYASTSQYFRARLVDGIKPVAGGYGGALCSNYKTKVGGTLSTFQNGECWYSATNISSNCYIAIKDLNYTDETAFKTAMSGVQLCYELATPTEITLTAEQISLLKGNNVLFTDGDNITLKYSADIKAYIDSQLNS